LSLSPCAGRNVLKPTGIRWKKGETIPDLMRHCPGRLPKTPPVTNGLQ
jgi:hypothetical protein